MLNKTNKNILLSIYFGSFGLILTNYIINNNKYIGFNDIKNEKDIEKIDIFNNNTILLTAKDKTKPSKYSYIPSYEILDKKLEKWEMEEIPLTLHPPSLFDYFITFLPYILLAIGFYFITKKPFPNSELFEINTSKLAVSKTYFNDIVGQKHAKDIISGYIDMLKNREKYSEMGAKLPRGVLLSGPPGTGKTLMAKAVAGETNLPFISLSGSDLTSMFVGAASYKVKKLYTDAGDLAKQNGGCVVFIDEIDAIGSQRNSTSNFAGNSERENTLNQLLTQLDGFKSMDNIMTFAATNRPEILDNALTRSGRFDRKIEMDLPHEVERQKLFEFYLNKINFHLKTNDPIIELLSKLTPGLSPADISNICNESAILGTKNKRDKVVKDDILTAIDNVTLGSVKDIQISKKSKEIIAYHEAGHALLSYLSSTLSNPIKVSIIPREKCLGYSQSVEREEIFNSKNQITESIKVLMAGRISEELFCQDVTIGAQSDIKKATKLANDLFKKWALDKDAFLEFDERIIDSRFGDETFSNLDKKIIDLVKNLYIETKDIINNNRDKIEKIKNLLLSKGTIYESDLNKIFNQTE